MKLSEKLKLYYQNVRSFMLFLAKRSKDDTILRVASSLSYTSLIALVPVLAIALAVFSAFPVFADVRQQIQDMFIQNLMPDAGQDLSMYFNPAVITNSIEDRHHGVDDKTMFLVDMSLQLLQFITVQMDQFPAFLTFTVETVDHVICPLADIFITGTAGGADDIFPDQSVCHQLVQMTVYGRHPQGHASVLEIIMDLRRCHMYTGPVPEIGGQLILLLCFITGPLCHLFLCRRRRPPVLSI